MFVLIKIHFINTHLLYLSLLIFNDKQTCILLSKNIVSEILWYIYIPICISLLKVHKHKLDIIIHYSNAVQIICFPEVPLESNDTSFHVYAV